MDENNELVQEFTQEADHLYEEWEVALSEFNFKTSNIDQFLGNLMRILHTIKGTAACVGLEDFSHGVHKLEDFYTNLKKLGQFSPDNLNRSFFLYSKMFEFFEIVKGTLKDTIDCEKNVVELLSSLGNESSQTSLDQLPKNETPVEEKPAAASPTGVKVKEKLSIEYDIIDTIAKLNGEMTVIRSTLTKSLNKLKQNKDKNDNIAELEDINGALNTVSTELMRQVSNLKLVSLQSFFRTIKRLVRDTSIKLNKTVVLKTEGENLYVDVKISKALSNICVHMIRNSLDHGLEDSSTRLKKQKDRSGTISLLVREIGEMYQIEIRDDGKGLDPDFILNKALEKNIISPSQAESLNKADILKLIFENGFSTSNTVSDLSGRGVGMDMVQTTISDLKGKINIQSELDQGTVFYIDIPKPKSVEILNAIKDNV